MSISHGGTKRRTYQRSGTRGGLKARSRAAVGNAAPCRKSAHAALHVALVGATACTQASSFKI